MITQELYSLIVGLVTLTFAIIFLLSAKKSREYSASEAFYAVGGFCLLSVSVIIFSVLIVHIGCHLPSVFPDKKVEQKK
mgnify:CR=1 FL=1